MGKKFWNFTRQGGMKNFQSQGRNFIGRIKFFWIRQGGNSKLRHKNKFENDIDSKVMPETILDGCSGWLQWLVGGCDLGL